MKYLSILVLLLITTSEHTFAAQMTGFARSYYQDERALQEVASTHSLLPNITLGSKSILMETSTLAEIAEAPFHKDSSATWLCLRSTEDINYWFISDNEMGKGLLTAIAIAKDGNHKECITTAEPIRVSITGLSLLEATRQDLIHTFGNIASIKKDAFLYYQETPVDNGFTQSNTVTYYLDGDRVRGVIIGQITSS
ncbi:MAG: hypothetical protein WAK61_04610 [Leclercia sp.]